MAEPILILILADVTTAIITIDGNIPNIALKSSTGIVLHCLLTRHYLCNPIQIKDASSKIRQLIIFFLKTSAKLLVMCCEVFSTFIAPNQQSLIRFSQMTNVIIEIISYNVQMIWLSLFDIFVPYPYSFINYRFELHRWLGHNISVYYIDVTPVTAYLYWFVVVNFDALAQASDIRIERRQVVFLCWMQDSNPSGSQTPNRQQTECPLTNRLSYRGSS